MPMLGDIVARLNAGSKPAELLAELVRQTNLLDDYTVPVPINLAEALLRELGEPVPEDD